MIQAVIFDMDGLLIDSEPFWRDAHVAVVGEKGFTLTHDDVRGMAGKGTSHVVEEWRQRFGWHPDENAAIEDRIVSHVLGEVKENGMALPGVRGLVKLLEKHDMPMAVASSSSQELIEIVMDRLGLREYMQVLHSAKHEKRSKPFPDVFLATAKSLQVGPVDCLVFEDSLNGVKAAKAAGMKCIAVPEQPYDETVFKAAGPDRIVGSLEEVTWELIQHV